MTAFELLVFDPPPPANVAATVEPLVLTGSSAGFAGYNQIDRILTTASGGTFTINPNGSGASTAIAGNASAGTVQTALEAAAGVAPGDVIVTGGPLGSVSTPVFIEWTGAFALENVVVTVNGSGTTGLARLMTQTHLPASSLGMEEIDLTPPPSKPDWVAGADSEWQALADIPKHENRKITMKVRVVEQASMDDAFDEIGSLVDRIRAAQSDRDGIQMQWTPSDSTRSVLFDVLNGDITGLPIGWETDPGYFLKRPSFTVELTCKPYWSDSTEVVTSATTAATPVVSMEVTAGGDVPALGRIIVTDNATQARRDVEWGLEGPDTYNSTTSLLLDSDSLVTSGFAGAGSTRTGAYDPGAAGNSVIRASAVLTSPIAVCGTGAQAHIGTFRVWARVYLARQTQAVRFAWRAGDTSYATNAWAQPPAAIDGQWAELDLGTITIPEALISTQRWDGRIEAFENSPTQGTPGALDVDYIRLTPAQNGYGRARAAYSYQPGVAVAYDQFTGITPGTVLNARAAPLGGSWVTSGATTDFVAVSPAAGGNLEQRSTTSDASRRFAILGATNYTDCEVSYDSSLAGSLFFSGGALSQLVIARYVDSSNYLYASLVRTSIHVLYLVKVIAGVETILSSVQVSAPLFALYKLRLIAYATGTAYAQLLDGSGVILGSISGTDTTIATSGTLATGKPGMADTNTTSAAITRYYDNFIEATPAAEPLVINSTRSMQFRHDATIRYDSGGTFVGGTPSYRGTRVLFPPGTSRVSTASRRADLNVSTADNVVDSTTIQVGVRDRGLVVPR